MKRSSDRQPAEATATPRFNADALSVVDRARFGIAPDLCVDGSKTGPLRILGMLGEGCSSRVFEVEDTAGARWALRLPSIDDDTFASIALDEHTVLAALRANPKLRRLSFQAALPTWSMTQPAWAADHWAVGVPVRYLDAGTWRAGWLTALAQPATVQSNAGVMSLPLDALRPVHHAYLMELWAPGESAFELPTLPDPATCRAREANICRVAARLVRQLRALHQCGFLHRDLHADNIMFHFGQGTAEAWGGPPVTDVTLVDFGFALQGIQPDTIVPTMLASFDEVPPISAPELLTHGQTKMVDLTGAQLFTAETWSLGFALFQWTFRLWGSQGDANERLTAYWRGDAPTPSIREGNGAALLAAECTLHRLLHGLLQRDPTARLSLHEAAAILAVAE